MFLYGAETWPITKDIERRINALDQWCLRRILNITWSEHVTNSEIHRRTGQPLLSDIVRARHLKLFGHVARADKSQDHSRALRACIWQSQELEAASRSSETYLAENGGSRPASAQPRSCIRVQEGTGQNYLACTHGNGYVTDKPRMMMMRDRCPVSH